MGAVVDSCQFTLDFNKYISTKAVKGFLNMTREEKNASLFSTPHCYGRVTNENLDNNDEQQLMLYDIKYNLDDQSK